MSSMWIRLLWCLVFSNNGSKVIFCRPDFYTLVLNNCQQSMVVTKGIVSQYLNEERRAGVLTVIRVIQPSSGCWTSPQWRGTPSQVANTSGTRSARCMAGQPHSCNLDGATTKAKGLSLKTTPAWKGNPDKTSHSSFHSSLTQDYTAAPYPRWPWATAAKWTAGGHGMWSPDTSYPTSTYCSSLMVMVQVPVTATAVNKILTPLFPIDKTCNKF